LKPGEPSRAKRILDEIKKQYLFKVKGFKPDQMVAATCLLEGPKDIVDMQMKQMFEIANKYHGLSGGAENGIKGYQLTYMIAYIRDFCLENNVVAESFETSCPWSQVEPLCRNVREEIYKAGEIYGMARRDMFVSFRVTQLYETGAAVYVYFSMNFENMPMDKVVEYYEDVEHRSRQAVLKYGGSISHHHGIGKLRKRFMEQSFSDVNNEFFKGVKQSLDPKNIFGINNTIYSSAQERARELGEDH
jgi:alkyldihydroxyacetonephosphate synthase